MATHSDTIKRGRKFDQVLEGARTIFMRDGFEGASVDDIAREASVSKATLYSYFPDKRLLFGQVSETECRRQADEAFEVLDMDAPPKEVLVEAAWRMVSFITSDFGIAVFKICIAESGRFPNLGQQFYDSGPKLVRERIVVYLKEATKRGELNITDFNFAAEQFLELTKTYIHPRILCGVQLTFSHAELAKIVHGSVEMFLARYGRDLD
ncbi:MULTISPECIES: TetR/AcrR family transcriptional regulator [Falsihalocynthiibacter]|uniref:TetR family transcriptional regulator n=1 Tax=Falsihalocynthiibacter arcticus TaxID=1579316 RepID=A0A126UXA2_9RHOB|nr:TetR/AcrR family transcriptional regulator [Falsihalocynthiibacter arcticus]AML50664.1 TetR family transcriptional regulator [Falsihalocynthiibacter arcticus]